MSDLLSTYDTSQYGINTTSTYGSDVVSNPGATLDKDAFLKLLLVELQYQDPTDPMDSEKMLTQTSQLAALEMQENTNKAMAELTNMMLNSMNMYALSAVGKMASVGYNAVTMQEGYGAAFEVYFPSEIKEGELIITDSNGTVVRRVELEAGQSGVLAFEWDGLDEAGNQLESGYYSVTAEYLDVDDQQQKTQFGVYPVESVRIDAGQVYVKLGSSYLPFEYVVEFY